MSDKATPRRRWPVKWVLGLGMYARGAASVTLGFVAPPLATFATIQLGVDDPRDCTDPVDEAKQEGRTGTEGAPLVTEAAPRGGPALSVPLGVIGKGDVAVRQLNQEKLNRIARRRP